MLETVNLAEQVFVEQPVEIKTFVLFVLARPYIPPLPVPFITECVKGNMSIRSLSWRKCCNVSKCECISLKC